MTVTLIDLEERCICDIPKLTCATHSGRLYDANVIFATAEFASHCACGERVYPGEQLHAYKTERRYGGKLVWRGECCD